MTDISDEQDHPYDAVLARLRAENERLRTMINEHSFAHSEAVAAERERCARIAERFPIIKAGYEIAAAIRKGEP